MKRLNRMAAGILGGLLLAGCASQTPYFYSYQHKDSSVKPGEVLNSIEMAPELEEKILALDPEHIGYREVQDILSKAPAPRILNIHGGIYPVHLMMVSFSEFLVGMGYPESSVRHPEDGSYSYSCYFDSRKIAGLLAWHYEREAMRPMMIGHSQGGMQAIRALYDLSGYFAKEIPIYNPLTKKTEERTTLIDPLTGEDRPVVGVSASYVTAVGAGGLTRILPNQWSTNMLLRTIPDTTDEFTGFSMGMDILGGDMLGAGGANAYVSGGKAAVRNVHLPLGYEHVTVPNTKHLALNAAVHEWVDSYHPVDNPRPPASLKGPQGNILWAADVWYSIKKHWCRELQTLIRKKRELSTPAAVTPAPVIPVSIPPDLMEIMPPAAAPVTGMPWYLSMNIRFLLVSLSGIIYWGVVLLRARRFKKTTGQSANLKPRGPSENMLWLGWLFVVVAWIGMPAFLKNGGAHWFFQLLLLPGKVDFIAGCVLLAGGYAGTWWCYWALGKNWRLGVNWSEKSALVMHGPYVYMRHPLYFFQLMMLAGVVALLPTVFSLMMLLLCILCMAVKIYEEEKYLAHTHGEAYLRYARRTGILWPRLF